MLAESSSGISELEDERKACDPSPDQHAYALKQATNEQISKFKC